MARVRVFGTTHRGKVREENQDDLLMGQPLPPDSARLELDKELNVALPIYLIVADGMGGAAGGRLAAEITTAVSFRYMCNNEWSQDEPPLAQAIKAADADIKGRTLDEPELRGMGAVTTACLVTESTIHFSQVGDTRLYRIGRTGLEQVTKDQTRVQELLDAGTITEEQAHSHPEKHLVAQAVGPMQNCRPVSSTLPNNHDDIFLMCSDGLTRHVSDPEIFLIMREASGLKEAATKLLDQALGCGGEDNITILLFQTLREKS